MDMIGSLLLGSAAALLGWWFVRAMTETDEEADEWRYDRVRIAELKRLDSLYRLLYPFFIPLARINRGLFRESLPEINREIQAAGLPRFWLPEEYLARCELLAVAMLPAFIVGGLSLMGPPGIVMAIVFSGLTAYLLRRNLASRAATRLT